MSFISKKMMNFIMVAECKSFSKASKFLFVTVPPLSRSIKNLEEELGFKLFVRKPWEVQLTDKGMWLFNKLNPIYKELRVITELAKKSLSSTLKIGSNLMHECIFNSLMPELDYCFYDFFDPLALRKSLENFSLSFAISSFDIPEDKNIKRIRLDDVPMVLAVPDGVDGDIYSIISKYPVTWCDVIGDASFKNELNNILLKKYNSSISDCSPDLFRCIDKVSKGNFIAIMPAPVTKSKLFSFVKLVPFTEISLAKFIYYIELSDLHENKKLKLFLTKIINTETTSQAAANSPPLSSVRPGVAIL